MENRKFIVVELQRTDNTFEDLEFKFDDYSQALNKYYTVLAYAAVSNVSVHSAALLDDTGAVMKNECFIHKSN